MNNVGIGAAVRRMLEIAAWLLLLGSTQLGMAADLPDVIVNVATHEATYRYVLQHGRLAAMPTGCLPENPCKFSDVMRTLQAHQSFVAQEASKNRGALPSNAWWAIFSNDKRLVVYGFERVFGYRSLSLAVAQPDQNGAIYSVDDPEVRIYCIRWLPNSQSLAILDGKSRSSKTPLGIFGALMGHGIPVTQYSLRIVSFASDGKISVARFPLPRTFKASEACLDMNE